MARRVPVTNLRDLADGTARTFEVAGTRMVLCRLRDRVYALENACSHDGGLLYVEVD